MTKVTLDDVLCKLARCYVKSENFLKLWKPLTIFDWIWNIVIMLCVLNTIRLFIRSTFWFVEWLFFK
jgi:hypothetical protein